MRGGRQLLPSSVATCLTGQMGVGGQEDRGLNPDLFYLRGEKHVTRFTPEPVLRAQWREPQRWCPRSPVRLIPKHSVPSGNSPPLALAPTPTLCSCDFDYFSFLQYVGCQN